MGWPPFIAGESHIKVGDWTKLSGARASKFRRSGGLVESCTLRKYTKYQQGRRPMHGRRRRRRRREALFGFHELAVESTSVRTFIIAGPFIF